MVNFHPVFGKRYTGPMQDVSVELPHYPTNTADIVIPSVNSRSAPITMPNDSESRDATVAHEQTVNMEHDPVKVNSKDHAGFLSTFPHALTMPQVYRACHLGSLDRVDAMCSSP